MNDILSYLFWPNPGNADYGSPKAMAAMAVCILFILGSFAVRFWRANKASQPMSKVSKSWGSVLFWFGLIGLILVVARVEQIQFIAMRFLWILWAAFLALVLYLQVRIYRNRYYEVLPNQTSVDPRSKYLPKRKRR